MRARKQGGEKSFEFQISIFELDAQQWSIAIYDFLFCVEQLVPNELLCIHELKQTFVIT